MACINLLIKIQYSSYHHIHSLLTYFTGNRYSKAHLYGTVKINTASLLPIVIATTKFSQRTENK